MFLLATISLIYWTYHCHTGTHTPHFHRSFQSPQKVYRHSQFRWSSINIPFIFYFFESKPLATELQTPNTETIQTLCREVSLVKTNPGLQHSRTMVLTTKAPLLLNITDYGHIKGCHKTQPLFWMIVSDITLIISDQYCVSTFPCLTPFLLLMMTFANFTLTVAEHQKRDKDTSTFSVTVYLFS